MRIEDPEQITLAPDGRPADQQPKWRHDFPIDWPKDEFRSRREFTRLLGLTSLAFVAGQAWIVMLSMARRSESNGSAMEIASVDNLPIGSAQLFFYPTRLDPCLLIRLTRDEFAAFSQKCTHLSCPVIPRIAQGKFYCPCHSGLFDLRTGYPLAGPPRRPLPRVLVEIRNGKVFATGVANQSVI